MRLDGFSLMGDVRGIGAGGFTGPESGDVTGVEGRNGIDDVLSRAEVSIGKRLHPRYRTGKLPLAASTLSDQIRLRDELTEDADEEFFVVCHGRKILQVPYR